MFFRFLAYVFTGWLLMATVSGLRSRDWNLSFHSRPWPTFVMHLPARLFPARSGATLTFSHKKQIPQARLMHSGKHHAQTSI